MVCNNKYMYTRENWNPNVYNIDIDYRNIASNRRTIFTDEIEEIAKYNLPASQKAYVEFKSKNFTNTNKVNIKNLLETINIKEKEKLNIEEFKRKIETKIYSNELNPEENKIYSYDKEVSLDNIILIRVKTNKGKRINKTLEEFQILQNNKTIQLKANILKKSKTNYTISDGKFRDLYIENMKGGGILKLKTTNPEYFKELIFYQKI